MRDCAFISPTVTITPEWEAFFVAILLDHGTRPSPELYGIERHNLEIEIAKIIDNHVATPPIFLKIKGALNELGGKPKYPSQHRPGRVVYRDSDDFVWFTMKMAAAYLDWLYAAGRLKEQRDALGG